MSASSATVVVIGGGAAGLFAAITAAELAPELTVLVMEAGGECLTKVRISGGGRCNVTHDCLDPHRLVTNYPRGGQELLGPFHHFGPQDTINWFTWRGVELKVETDGRMFPVTDDSATIATCLLDAAAAAGVQIRTRCAVRSLTAHPEGGWSVVTKAGDNVHAAAVVLATGSSRPGHALAAAVGHRLIPPVPSLFTLTIRESWLTALAGTSVPHARIHLEGLDEPIATEGPLLCTHWGLSGPAVLRASAWGARALHAANYRCTAIVDWLGDGSAESVVAALRAEHAAKTLGAVPPPGALTRRLWRALLVAGHLSAEMRVANMSAKDLHQLVNVLGACRLAVAGKGVFKEEFVTAGGVAREEINWRRMESRVAPGLHVVGECLDVDAITGGFNFQNAWTTGYLAGCAIAGQ